MASKSRQELGLGGQRHLEETIDAAFHILSSMNDELCNPALWTTSSTSSAAAGDASADTSTHTPDASTTAVAAAGGGGGGALDEARLRYKSAVAALRAVLAAVPNSPQELTSKNKHLKLLIDQLRDLIDDIAMWQSPCSV